MRVFILSTGRCGSVTFSKACVHLTNYTSGHESRAARVGEHRFEYQDRHIEADNRLSWFLGGLGRRFDPQHTLYVHLTRDSEQVARSFLARWDSPYPASMIRAFGQGIVTHRGWPEEERLDVCRFYVRTVNDNIAQFMRHQPLTMSVRLEAVRDDFPRFLDRIDAEGDLTAARAEWSTRHNASPRP